MQYRTFAKTGLNVSVMGFGCGGPSRAGKNTGKTFDESVAVLRYALDSGINYIDTAEVYQTEEIVGKAIRDLKREDVIISSKFGPWEDMTESDVETKCNESLQRLGTDYIDIYNFHGVTAERYNSFVRDKIPYLQKLKDKGKIRFLGITEQFNGDKNHDMFQTALNDGVWEVVMVGFNVLNQTARERVLPKTSEKGVAVQIMFPVRKALSKPDRLKEVMNELVQSGEIDPDEFNMDDPFDFLPRGGGTPSIVDAAYRFVRDEPGCDLILSGTGDIEHCKANIETFNNPPLPKEVTEKLKHLFRM